MLPMLKTHTFTKLKNVCRCLALHLLKTGPISFAIDHSPCARMTAILAKEFDSVAVSESISSSSMTNLSVSWGERLSTHGSHSLLLPTFHQISTLEKTTFRQCSILSLMSSRPSQVSPFLVAAHSTSSEVFDFQIWFSPGFPRPNSSSASILL